jgi:hypothetical protein
MTANGGGDIYLAKLDPSGAGIWSEHFGDSSSENLNIGQVVTVDGFGNPTIAGGLNGNANFGGGLLFGSEGGAPFPYVAGFDSTGTYAWASVGNNQGAVQAISHSATSQLVLAGAAVVGTLDFAGGSFDPDNAILMTLAP